MISLPTIYRFVSLFSYFTFSSSQNNFFLIFDNSFLCIFFTSGSFLHFLLLFLPSFLSLPFYLSILSFLLSFPLLSFYPFCEFSLFHMVFILDCCSFHYAHIWSKSGISICWWHLVTSKESSHPIFLSYARNVKWTTI